MRAILRVRVDLIAILEPRIRVRGVMNRNSEPEDRHAVTGAGAARRRAALWQ